MNTSESDLTPANVSTLTRVGQYGLDGAIFAQPLYIPAVTMPDRTHNVLIAATMANSVYCLDADNSGLVIWRLNFGSTWSNPSSGPFYGGAIGILSTPVVDVANGYIYAVSVSSTPTYTLHKIALATGIEVTSTAISGSVVGAGGGAGDNRSGANLLFKASWQLQRPPLTLSGGKVYVAFGSNNQEDPGNFWHGWVMAYDTSDLSQVGIFCTTANGIGAGIWEAGGGLAVDGSGNVYFATGNGDWDGSTNFSQSIVKLGPTLSLLDWFTPSNEAATSAVDADVSSGRVMLITGTKYLTFGSKDARVWVLDSTDMGHLQGTGTAPQVFNAATVTAGPGTGIYGGAFFNGTGYFPVAGQATRAFSWTGTTFTTAALATTAANFSQIAMTGSSNAGANPILWGLTVSTSATFNPQPVTLRAFDPATLTESWNSGTTIGNYGKFVAPTVANGRVFVASNNGTIIVFGLP